MAEQLVTAQAVFGSKSKTVVLKEVAKAVKPVSAYALARISGLDPKNLYEECVKLNNIGIFQSISTGKNQTCYLYSDSEEAAKLKQFVQSLNRKKRASGPSIIEKISDSLPMTDYYVSLPIALRIAFDVFYSPDYLMIFVDQRKNAMIPKLRRSVQLANLGKPGQKTSVMIKAVSLWGREFKYDEAIDASLASNEQSIADGLNYYEEIKDREIIRTLGARTSDFDLRKVINKLSEKGMSRLYAIVVLKDKIKGKLESQEQDVLALFRKRKKAIRLDKDFKSDLRIEAIPMLFPNDEANRKEKGKTWIEATASISEVLKSFA